MMKPLLLSYIPVIITENLYGIATTESVYPVSFYQNGNLK